MFDRGTVNLTDMDGLCAWYRSLSYEEAEEVRKKLWQPFEKMPSDSRPDFVTAIDSWYTIRGGWASWPKEMTPEYKWPVQQEENLRRIHQISAFHMEYKQDLKVSAWEPGQYACIYIGNPKSGLVIPDPERFFEYVPEKSYDELTPAQVRAALLTSGTGERSMLPSEAQTKLSPASVRSLRAEAESDLGKLLKEQDDVLHARTEELAKLQEEIDRKKAELQAQIDAKMEVLRAKQEQMEAQVEQLQNQIWLLDSQIYSIRCYAGKVVNFGKVREGAAAPDTEPIVIHQKLRFLDEELGRLASLYSIQWGEMGLFEQFLAHHPAALDTFAPNERCVTLVRLSRNAKEIGIDQEQPWSNMLEDYEYYHGRTIGIIVRNGENLYLGWTDEQRVHIEDDLILSQVITEEPEPIPENISDYELKRREKEYKAQRKQILDGLISRTFVYNILQGLVDNTPILPLPKGTTLGKQSEYVIYSVADRWLKDTRFGSFTDIIERANSKIAEGDDILVVQHLLPNPGYGRNRYTSPAWYNDRGRGERNRTHDCSVDDCTIYPVNMIEFDPPVRMVSYSYRAYDEFSADKTLKECGPIETTWDDFETRTRFMLKATGPDGKDIRIARRINPDTNEYETVARNAGWHYGDVDYTVLGFREEIKRHLYVSVRKKDTWTTGGEQSSARANFELYSKEYINLTYLNSVVLEWVINNRELGDWRIQGHSVDYAYAIRYLNTMMDYIRKREAEEKRLIDSIDAGITLDKEWPLKLTEFKFEKAVRKLTEYQAKRFVKWLRSRERASQEEGMN